MGPATRDDRDRPDRWGNEPRALVVALLLLGMVLVVIGGVAAFAGDDLNRPAGSEPAAPTTTATFAPLTVPAGAATDVVLLGDSITAANEPVLRSALEPAYQVRVAAHSGYRVDELVAEARPLADDQPAQLIVNLGTNDVLYDWPLEDSMDAYEELLDLFGEADCVHLVTINEDMYNPADAALSRRAAAFNAALSDLAAARGGDLIEWDEAVQRDIEARQPNGPITFDTVHPTAFGAGVLAGLYRDAVISCG